MSIKFIILGCGSSLGVPRIDGFFGNCDPKNKKNYRTRCCALIKSKNTLRMHAEKMIKKTFIASLFIMRVPSYKVRFLIAGGIISPA